MAQITEFTTLALKPEANQILDPSTPEGKTIETSNARLRAIPGVEFVKCSPRLEDKNILHIFVVWSSTACHSSFLASPDYTSYLSNLQSLSPNSSSYHSTLYSLPLAPHYTITPAVPQAFSTPATEVFQVLLPSSTFTSTLKGEWDARLEQFLKGTKPVAQGVKTVALGWSQGEVDCDAVEGGKARCLMGLMGWKEGVEGHMKFRETEEYQREAKEFEGAYIEIAHVEEGVRN